MTTKRETAAQQEARTQLRKILKPGDTVYGIVRNVSRSGMSRQIDFYAMPKKAGERPWCITYGISALLGYRRARDGWSSPIIVQGCGMDMIFHVVYQLATVLFSDYKGRDIAKLPARVRPLFRGHGQYVDGVHVPASKVEETGYLLKHEQL